MPSDALPAEVLFCIAKFLGSHYLRVRTDRLLLFKGWLYPSNASIDYKANKQFNRYQVAQLVAFEDLTITIRSLQRFLEAPCSAHTLVQSCVRRLSVEGIHLYGDDSQEGLQAPLDDQFSSQYIECCQSLNFLATLIPEMTSLHTFRLKILIDSPSSISEENRWSQTIIILISPLPKSVTHLVVDNPGQSPRVILDSTGGADQDHLICHLFCARNFLPSLRHLRLCMRIICPQVLKMKSSNEHPLLETMVLNLSLHEEGVNVTDLAQYCAGYRSRMAGLYLDMLVMAEDVALEFPALRTLRILHPKFLSLTIGSDDAVLKRRVVLPENVPWDDVDWDDEGFTDDDGHEESDVDLFDDSASEASQIPIAFSAYSTFAKAFFIQGNVGNSHSSVSTHHQSRLALR